MQEAELSERVEQFFASALAQTYQRDALIELYHLLRQTWSQLESTAGAEIYPHELREALRLIAGTCLRMQGLSQAEDEDRQVIESIQQYALQLEEEV